VVATFVTGARERAFVSLPVAELCELGPLHQFARAVLVLAAHASGMLGDSGLLGLRRVRPLEVSQPKQALRPAIGGGTAAGGMRGRRVGTARGVPLKRKRRTPRGVRRSFARGGWWQYRETMSTIARIGPHHSCSGLSYRPRSSSSCDGRTQGPVMPFLGTRPMKRYDLSMPAPAAAEHKH
jgi:hypothetical protein